MTDYPNSDEEFELTHGEEEFDRLIELEGKLKSGPHPDTDEEFELSYGDELELLKEQEEQAVREITARPSRNLDLIPTSQQPLVRNTVSNQDSIVSSTTDSPSCSGWSQSQPQVLEQPYTKEITQERPARTQTDIEGGKKRSIEELFGDIDDILDEEIISGQIKKRKTIKINDDLSLIDHILELRKLAKERHSSVTVLSTDHATTNNDFNKNNLSYRIPKYSFVGVTRDDDKRIYVRFHSEEYEKEEIKKIAKQGSFSGVMGERFKEIWKEAEQYLNKSLDRESGQECSQTEQTNIADISVLKEPSVDSTQLWVDLYKPRKYLELLSDESTNRTLLRWLKLWDKVVFNRGPKPKLVKGDVKESKFKKFELNMNLDEHGCPQHKVVLLCGPPGLGKTTLAHMIARHAGYNVVEVNASDDRSTEKFKTILENATQMLSVIDKENRPNCIVFDEIDGAPAASIEFLIKFIKGTVTNTKKKKGATQNTKILKRPIICICNDVYVPALRPLRQLAFVVNFPPTASVRLAERLFEIARHQKVKTDIGALLALCEKSGNDIRSCLSVLHFFKSLSKPITLSNVYKTSVGQKDMQKGLFTVWQDIFQIQRSKHKIALPDDSVNGTEKNTQNDDMSLKSRMQKILNLINSFGDYERVAQGVFENYPNMYIKDSSLKETCEAMEWFCYTDVMNNYIYSLQNYSLSSYLPYAFVVWHFVFASMARPKLVYPSTSYEVKVKTAKTVALLEEVMKGMQPSVRAFTYSSSLLLDVLPILSYIITPVFRPVNLHLYTSQEKEQLNHVVSVMIDYNLNYVQERMPEGNYVYNLDPNVDDIILFPTSQPRRLLSYCNKQLIAAEIGTVKMRQIEMHKTGSTSSNYPRNSKIDKGKSPKQLPNHLQKLKPKTMQPKREGMVSKDFFGRIVTKASDTAQTNSNQKNDIWFQYKEGYSSAVRKYIKISNLM